MTNTVNEFEIKSKGTEAKLKTPEEVAYGFIQVANESMSRPIRSMTVSKGYDTRDHVLCCFGGAGAQHAVSIARNLGMKKVFIHRQSGILSAYGLGLADVVNDEQEPCSKEYSPENFTYFAERLRELKSRVVSKLKESGFEESSIQITNYLNIKYKGTDYTIMTNIPADALLEKGLLDGDYAIQFEKAYKREYGFNIQGRSLVVDDIRVRGVGSTHSLLKVEIPTSSAPPKPITTCKTFYDKGWLETDVYSLDQLGASDKIEGPAIIIHETTTILIEPNSIATITKYGDVEIAILSPKVQEININELKKVDSVRLSIFNHRFMGIAEQQGM